MPLSPLDVIWIHDGCIRPPGPKMVVCIAPALGLFFRINTKGCWQQSVRLVRIPHHPFLTHDSHLECGDPLDLDEYVVQESLKGRGVIGRVTRVLIPDILGAIEKAPTLSAADKRALGDALRNA